MDPYTAATIASTLGNIIGGFGRKKAAKGRYRKRVKRIKSAFSQRMEDLKAATGEVVGGIEAASRARGTRGAPDLLESEIDKFQLRTLRLQQNESEAIADAASERRQGIKAGDFQIATSVAQFPFSYNLAQQQSQLAADRKEYYGMRDNWTGQYGTTDASWMEA